MTFTRSCLTFRHKIFLGVDAYEIMPQLIHSQMKPYMKEGRDESAKELKVQQETNRFDGERRSCMDSM